MQLNRPGRRAAWGEIRSTDNRTGYPREIDAYRFEKPSRVTFRVVEHVASHAGVIEQFDGQRLPSSTRRALRCPERKQKNKRDTRRHAAAYTQPRRTAVI